jgi:hypothetical protein
MDGPTLISGNNAIEEAAVRLVIDLERGAGREPIDRRHVAAFPADIESGDRFIEVKAFGGRPRGSFLWLEVVQVESARVHPNFWIYVVDNIRQGDPHAFGLRLLGGEQLARMLVRAREKRYFEVPFPVGEYDSAPGPESLR